MLLFLQEEDSRRELVKKELQQMLRTPLSHQVYGGACPTTMGGGMPTDMLARKEEKAVDAPQTNSNYTQNLLRKKHLKQI